MISPHIDNVGAEPKPWFIARVRGGSVEIEGEPRCALGRRIKLSGRSHDEGVYLDWAWDGRKLVIENDRFGLYPLFYCAHDGLICISPSLEKVVKRSSERQLDYSALSVFFRMGHFIGEDTPFADVRFMPPNSVLTWAGGRLEIASKGDHLVSGSVSSLDFDETVDRYRELFSRSISRRLPEDSRFTVPVSGGRDSRHILLELARQGVRPRSCATVKYRPPATNEDVRIARLLADRLDIEHVELEKPRSFFRAELNDVALTNYCGGGHGWVQPVASNFAGHYTTIYDGLAGSVLSGGFMLAEDKVKLFRQGSFNELALTLVGENKNEGALRNIFSRDFYRRISLEKTVERLACELRTHAEAPNPVLSFVFWNRTRRCVASIPFAIFHEVPVVHVPYLDHDLFDLLFSLDASVVEHNRLHDEAIRRSYPEFSDIPYEDKKAKAVFSKMDCSYYRAARAEFFSYLWGCSKRDIVKVSRQYLFMKLGADLIARKVDAPWYIRPALQAIEIERLAGG